MNEKFSTRLRKILTKQNIRPAELARLTGFSESLISQYLNDKTKPKNDRILIIAKALNISPLTLLDDEIIQEIEEDWNTPTNQSEKENMINRTLSDIKTLFGDGAYNILSNYLGSSEEGQEWLENRSSEAKKFYPKGEE